MSPGRPGVLCLFLMWPWPANSGGRIRAAAVVHALAADHDVRVLAADHAESGYPAWDAAVRDLLARRASPVARARDIIEAAAVGDHTAALRAVHAGLPSAFADVLAELRPSIVVLGRPYFGPFITAARTAGASVIIDADERLPRLARATLVAPRMPVSARLRAAIEVSSLARMESREYPRADRVWVASTGERQNFDGIVPPDRVDAVPNPIPFAGAVPAAGAISAVAYIGWYGHAPNEAAALELILDVMPAVRSAGGPRQLVLIGRAPTPAMRRAAARTGEVEITGEVAHGRALLSAAGLLALPIRAAGGTRIKVLEAAAIGVPVVSTRLGVEGLDLAPGVHYLAAATPHEFASAIIALRDDPALRDRIVTSARAQIIERHGPQAILAAVRGSLARLT